MVTLVDVSAFEKWGRTWHRFRFRDNQGHCFIWWSDIDDAGIPARSRALARMTVTEHSRYQSSLNCSTVRDTYPEYLSDSSNNRSCFVNCFFLSCPERYRIRLQSDLLNDTSRKENWRSSTNAGRMAPQRLEIPSKKICRWRICPALGRK